MKVEVQNEPLSIDRKRLAQFACLDYANCRTRCIIARDHPRTGWRISAGFSHPFGCDTLPSPYPYTGAYAPQADTDGGDSPSCQNLVRTVTGYTYRLVTIPRETFKGQGELCDLQVSPDGRYAAVSICATEGVIFDVFIVDLAQGTGFQIGICQQDMTQGCRFKPTWFRGWFPDSRRVLLITS